MKIGVNNSRKLNSRIPQRRRKEGNDACKQGVCPEVSDAYITEKICKDPPIRHPEQHLEAWVTLGTAILFENPSYCSKTENFAPAISMLQ